MRVVDVYEFGQEYTDAMRTVRYSDYKTKLVLRGANVAPQAESREEK